MKARVIATGKIVEVTRIVDRYVMTHHPHNITFDKEELDFELEDDPDYWTRLEHQYAGMAIQGLMSYIEQVTPTEGSSYCDTIVDFSVAVAHALVEKMKEEKK